MTSILLAVAVLGQQPVRLNHIQVIGTHNSYHAGLAPNEAALFAKMNPKAASSLDYRQPPLQDQLRAGVRQFEFDIYSDSKGGLFADPLLPRLLAKENLPADPPFDSGGLLRKPGFKVIHVQDYDYRSTCQPFTRCLEEIRDWSLANPRHLPIFLLIENKLERPERPGTAQPEPLTRPVLDALDREILSVFARRHIVTPDDVRGDEPTLEGAILKRGWPTVDSARGKVIFLLDQERVTPLYREGHPSLRGRILFTNGKPGDPDAAFVKMNDATSPQIPELVRKGYLVRTMTDGGLENVKAGKTERRETALASGAHMLSTDFPFDYTAPGSGFSVRFPEGSIARCNPVVRAPGCTAAALRE